MNFAFTILSVFSGAAEIRTRVQTKHPYAFYMRSLFLNFRRLAGVQATNRQLIFLRFDSLSKRRVSISSASAKRSGHYTLIVGISKISYTVQKAMLILN